MNYCTLFDSGYLARGIAMIESLVRHSPDCRVYVVACDDAAVRILERLSIANVEVIPLARIEDDALLEVKPGRSRSEYYWTITSSTILYTLTEYDLDVCTYVDADMFFFASPSVLFEEMGDASILLTRHNYSRPYDQSRGRGIHCVQFMTFRNDERGMAALTWWRSACVDWCFAYLDAGRFGDQKYLDDWPTRYEGVHVLDYDGGWLAPWNIQQFDLRAVGDGVIARNRKTNLESTAVLYHFHSLRFYRDGNDVDLGWYFLPRSVKSVLYATYLREIRSITARLLELDSGIVFYPCTKRFGSVPDSVKQLVGFNIHKTRVVEGW